MGKGDKKTIKGKIRKGTFGKKRVLKKLQKELNPQQEAEILTKRRLRKLSWLF